MVKERSRFGGLATNDPNYGPVLQSVRELGIVHFAEDRCQLGHAGESEPRRVAIRQAVGIEFLQADRLVRAESGPAVRSRPTARIRDMRPPRSRAWPPRRRNVSTTMRAARSPGDEATSGTPAWSHARPGRVTEHG